VAKQVRLADQPLKNILRQTVGQDSHRTLFNNAAQAWNHAFYWRSLWPVLTLGLRTFAKTFRAMMCRPWAHLRQKAPQAHLKKGLDHLDAVRERFQPAGQPAWHP
jgi:superoxide dismutase